MNRTRALSRSNSKLNRRTRTSSTTPQRRGAITVLAAVLMVVMLGFVAFGVDVGYMMVVKTQLQNAADSAAMSAAANLAGTQTQIQNAAKDFAGYHKAAGSDVTLTNSDIQFGVWDSGSRTFTASSSVGNAVKVTARRDSSTGSNSTFFGRIFGTNTFNVAASAVAIGNPRDICFVVDLSGSMNRDTWTGYGSSADYRSSGYTTIYESMMQQIFTDFGFGTYPGTTQNVALQLGSPSWSTLTGTSSPLKNSSFTYGGQSYTISSTYKILGTDSSSTRKTKAYKWIIDKQLNGTFACLGAAKPTPDSSNSTSYNYWRQYIDSVVSNNGVLGPRTYISWCLDSGRDQVADPTYGSDYGELSVNSPNCPYHTESTAGGSFSFPPSEQPTHSERRSVIAGLQKIKDKNTAVTDSNQKDWVSIVTFDKTAGTVVRLGLTSDYNAAMTSSATMQAVGYSGNSTSTETGLIAAYNLIKPQSQGGTGRESTQKVVILLTDGVANLKTSSDTTVANYRTAHPSDNFYGGSGDYPSDAAMMQVSTMEAANWKVFALALGLAADYDFMDRMARTGGTADNNGHAPTTSGDPSTYESEMTALLDQIVDNPQVRLVQ